MSYRAGFGKSDMTSYIPSIGMMGYGQPHNTVKNIMTPLIARVMILKQNEKKFSLIHLEQAFITIALKEAVLNTLNTYFKTNDFNEANTLLSAQHTHSAPGGYSHYPLYNFTIPGLRPRVIEKLTSSILEAYQDAIRSLSAVTLHYGEHEINENVELAYNRSMKAFLNNENATDLKETENHLAVNRKMHGLAIKDENNQLKGFLNWFGVHCTSISSFNHSIHHDNKGIAAHLFEKDHPECTAFFMQASAGDISPNNVWDKKLSRMRGPSKDQYENAFINGELQFQESKKIENSSPITGELKFQHHFYDVTQVASFPAHGIAFFEGTKEGPGIPKFLASILKQISLITTDKEFASAHGKKRILLDHRNGKFIGIPLSAWKYLPPIPEKAVEYFRIEAKKESIKTLPWVPTVLPFQLIHIGPLTLVACAGEITTVAAKRLLDDIQEMLPQQKLILTSYANAYMGYITTPEEYAIQCYEGGHTVYGPKTLEAFSQGFINLIQNNTDETTRPIKFPESELEKRTVWDT